MVWPLTGMTMMAPEHMTRTFWLCDVCSAGGHIDLPEHAGAWEGITAVEDAHQAASPACQETYRIRVSLVPDQKEKNDERISKAD